MSMERLWNVLVFTQLFLPLSKTNMQMLKCLLPDSSSTLYKIDVNTFFIGSFGPKFGGTSKFPRGPLMVLDYYRLATVAFRFQHPRALVILYDNIIRPTRIRACTPLSFA